MIKPAWFWSVAGAAIATCTSSLACEPVWVRPIDLSAHASAALGTVEAVDWLHGRITVATLKSLRGSPPAKSVVGFNNVPFTCGWQPFRRGQQVYVFGSRHAWAAKVADVEFSSAPAKR